MFYLFVLLEVVITHGWSQKTFPNTCYNPEFDVAVLALWQGRHVIRGVFNSCSLGVKLPLCCYTLNLFLTANPFLFLSWDTPYV